jgi:hypothetical protein
LRSAFSASSGFSCFSYTLASAIQPRGSSGLRSVIQRAIARARVEVVGLDVDLVQQPSRFLVDRVALLVEQELLRVRGVLLDPVELREDAAHVGSSGASSRARRACSTARSSSPLRARISAIIRCSSGDCSSFSSARSSAAIASCGRPSARCS